MVNQPPRSMDGCAEPTDHTLCLQDGSLDGRPRDHSREDARGRRFVRGTSVRRGTPLWVPVAESSAVRLSPDGWPMTHRWNVAVRVTTWISSLCACMVFMQAPSFDRRAAAGDGLERAHGWPWCNDQQTDRRVKMALRVETPEVSTTGSRNFTLTFKNTGAEAVSLSTPLAFGHNLFLKLEGGAGVVPMSGVMTGIVPGKPRVLRL